MNTALMTQYKYLTKEGEGAQTFPSSAPCYLPSKANACYEAANGSPIFYGKCYQDGTPSPSSPVTVQYVDGTAITSAFVVSRETVVSAGVNEVITPAYSGTTKYGVSIISPCKKGDTFAFAANGDCTIDKSVYTSYNRFRVATTASNPLTASTGTINAITKPYDDSTRTTGSVTIEDEQSKYIVFTFCFTNNEALANKASRDISVAGTTASSITVPDLYGVNDVRDTYEPCVLVDGALKSRLTRRIGVVDLGGVTWGRVAIGNFYYFSTTYFNDLISNPASTSEVVKALCTNLGVGSWNSIYKDDVDECICCMSTGTTLVRARYDGMTNVASFTEAMSGKLFYYPLKTPIITLGDPQPVQSYGGTTNIFHTSAVQPKIGATVVTHS